VRNKEHYINSQIYISGISPKVTADHLFKCFGEFGKIVQIKCRKYHGLVTFDNIGSAIKAVNNTD
jgi:RNA recognition motif-containing protein